MKIAALKEHRCHCCEETIGKGQECFVFIVNPTNPDKSEFDLVYTCSKCINEDACKVRIKKRGAAT